VQAEDLVAQLESMSDEELSLVVDELSDLVARIRRKAARSHLLELADRAAQTVAPDDRLDADGIARVLDREREHG